MKLNIRLVPLCLILLLIVGLLLTPAPRTASAQKEDAGMSETAVRQIQSLIQEKESRTEAQKKIDSQLLYAVKQSRGEAITSAVPTLEVNVNAGADGLVAVDIKANVTKELLNGIVKAGGQVLFHSEEYNTVNARLPLAALEQLAASEDVQFIYPADRGRTHGLGSEGAGGATTAAPARGGAAPAVRINSSLRGKLRPDFADRAARVRARLADALRAPALASALRRVGSVTSEGDTTHRAAEGRSFFGVNGTGVKVGVLSDGVSNLAASQASGDLPAVTVLPGQAGSGDEGTAMLEIIYDLAPGAQLFFATAFTSQASFAANIIALRNAGCDIIVDDVGYFREAVFQDDNVAQSVNTVTAAGALYFSSAGNEGNLTDNTSGVWEGDFVDGGTLTVGATTLPGTVNDFGGGNKTNQLTASNGGAPIGLFWSDPLGGSGNDYDLYILDAGQTTVVNAATNVQDGNDDPVELSTISPAAGRRLVILKKTGAAVRALHLNSFRGLLTFKTTGQVHGHAAAADAYAVAATPADEPFGPPPNPVGPFPGPHNSGNLTELFSSDGPRRMFYNANGTPITPGNLLFGTNGGAVRQKPDITAADGVSVTGVGGFPSPFYGTSASAPHAAAIAALVKSGVPGITPAQIRTALTSSAIDIEAPGVDRDTGFGIVMAFQALQAAGAAPQPVIAAAGSTLVNESCPPSNGAVDPGERVTVNLRLTNSGGASTTNLVATLQPSASVVAPSDPQSYGAIAPASTVGRDFTFTANGMCGDTITLTLQLQDGANNLGTVTYTFRLGVFTQSSSTFSNPAAIAVPGTGTTGPAAPYPSTISVAGVTGTVAKVTVRLNNLSHTWPDDIDVLLVGPGGQKVMLMSDAGDGFTYDLTGANLVFDDAAAGGVPDEGTIPSNATTTYKPTDIGTTDTLPAPAPGRPFAATLAAFNGVNPNGTWSLYVADDVSGDVGSIAGGWSITITTETGTCNTSCAVPRLVVKSTLTRTSPTTVQATYTIQNVGVVQADNVTLTTAKLGATNGAPLPQPLGSIAPGATTAPQNVTFANSTPGASSTLTLGGTYTGGTFSSTKRVTIP